MRLATAMFATLVLLILAGCGGGGSSNINVVGSQQPDLKPNSIVISDMLATHLGRTERISQVNCSPDLTACEVTYRGYRYTLPLDDSDDDSDVDGTIYTSLGTWNHMRMGAVYGYSEGVELTFGMAGGVRYSNSLPLTGSASWQGEMVALDDNNRLVRGDAYLEIEDLRSPSVYVALSPQAYPAMIWDDIPLRERALPRAAIVERLHQRRILRAERRGGRRGVRALSSDRRVRRQAPVNWNDDFVCEVPTGQGIGLVAWASAVITAPVA